MSSLNCEHIHTKNIAHYRDLAYSTYCSLKYLSGQGYLSQESQQSGWTAFYYCVAYLWWVDERTGRAM